VRSEGATRIAFCLSDHLCYEEQRDACKGCCEGTRADNPRLCELSFRYPPLAHEGPATTFSALHRIASATARPLWNHRVFTGRNIERYNRKRQRTVDATEMLTYIIAELQPPYERFCSDVTVPS
jgi:hypothetical protein